MNSLVFMQKNINVADNIKNVINEKFMFETKLPLYHIDKALFFALPSKKFCGAWILFEQEDTSIDNKEFIEQQQKLRYAVKVCKSIDDAIQFLNVYLSDVLHCPRCFSIDLKLHGQTYKSKTRYRCANKQCKKTFVVQSH